MNKELKVIFLNIKSSRNKIKHLEALFSEEYYKNEDVIVLTKTWLYNTKTKSINTVTYQDIFRCRNNGREGGVAVFKRIKETMIFGQTEVLIIPITIINGPVKITAAYKPLNVNNNNNFFAVLKCLLDMHSDSHIIIGVMNINICKNM